MRAPVACALLVALLSDAACSSFETNSATTSPDHAPATGPEPSPAPDAAVPEVAPPPAAPRCIPQPLEAVPKAEDPSCEPGSPPFDLMGSSRHCGRCGHDCLGDPCVNGLCAVKAVSTGEDGPPSLTLSGGTLFYTTTNSGRLVRSLSPSGGAPTTLATIASGGGFLGGTLVEGTDLFFKQSDVGILRMPSAGGTPTTFVALGGNRLGAIAVDATNVYYVADTSLEAMPRGAGNAFVVQGKGAAALEGLAADGTYVMWGSRAADPGGGVGPTTLQLRGTGPSDSAVARATGLAPIHGLTTDADYIYIATVDGEIRRVLKQGVTAPELIGKITIGPMVPKGIAVDADHVYVACTADAAGGTVQMRLYQMSKCGGPVRLIADEKNNIFARGLISVGPHLYWGNQSSVSRIAK